MLDAVFIKISPEGFGRILLVENNVGVRNLMALLLAGAGLKVETVPNGSGTLDCIRDSNRPFDVVLTGHAMPQMRGLELVREMARTPNQPPVVVCSTALTAAEKIDYLTLGVRSFVEKPFRGSAVLGAVN